jgi:cephalosporin hydroxylase
MNAVEQFNVDVAESIANLGADKDLQALSRIWLRQISDHKYSHNFRWLGRPIIQVPQDILALQEIIFSVKPDVIVETGIAHGGSLVFSASMLALLDMMDAVEAGTHIDPGGSVRKVVGVDIDIREHNRSAIQKHPMASRIRMIQGSSVDPAVVSQVWGEIEEGQKVLVLLDSNHTHDHVLAELQAYAPMVSLNSYCIVFDTLVEDMPSSMFPDRPWGPGNSPKTAVHAYLEGHGDFVIDKAIDHKLLISVAPDGYLRRVR